MKIVVLVCFYFFSLYAGEVKHITLDNKDLTSIEESYNLYGSRGTSVSFYIEKNRDLRFLKTFTSEYKSGDCMNRELERGVYKVKGKEIVFYTLKSLKKKIGKVPLYAEILRYKLQNGELKLIDKKFYSKDKKDVNTLEKVQNIIKSSRDSTQHTWKKINN